MPFYYRIDGTRPGERRIAVGLLRLKSALAGGEGRVPPRTISDTLLLATWNIREFDSTKYGVRGKEPLFYIAEIVSAFDLVAVQEVRDDLRALRRLMKVLGGWWKVIMTDVTEGSRGNRERMAFLYDSRKITFGGLAGEVVIPPVRSGGTKYEPAEQLARTPFVVGLKAGWFRFTICTTHILYGKSVAEDPERVREIELLAKFLAARSREDHAWARNMLLLGDFNIFRPQDTTMQALTKHGFTVPPQLQKLPANALRNKHYDQIAFIAPEIHDQLELCRAGVFDYYEHVYREDEEETYATEMGDAYAGRDAAGRRRYYREWRTHQMSDHLPMWIELKIDFGEEYLRGKSRAPEA
jgi:endonuclease/exonuclease/phosphatase family metal-dependent hydrolase